MTDHLISDIYHRFKNHLSILVSLFQLQSRRTDNEQLLDILTISQLRTLCIAIIYETAQKSKNYTEISLKEYIPKIIKAIIVTYNAKVKTLINVEDIYLDFDKTVTVALIITELISNIIKHAFPKRSDGTISLTIRIIKNEDIELSIKDNGIGIPKNINLKDIKTLGLNLVKDLTEQQLEGSLDIKIANGTYFIIKFNKQN
ncbi:MAG: hypothetical protein HQK79_16040 [Desulfobacterales bacterium]|nr:hypothetical protein [Desulfobacterales bacterium]